MNTIVKKCQLLHLLSAWGDSELCLAIFTDKCVTQWGNCFFFLNKTFIMKVNVKSKQSITLFTSHWLLQNFFSRFRPIEIWTNLQYEENWMHWIFYWQQCGSPFFESWRLVFCHLRQLFLGLFEFLWWLLVPRLGVRHDYVIGQAGAKYMSCCYECCLCIFANLLCYYHLISHFSFVKSIWTFAGESAGITHHGFPEQFSALLSNMSTFVRLDCCFLQAGFVKIACEDLYHWIFRLLFFSCSAVLVAPSFKG